MAHELSLLLRDGRTPEPVDLRLRDGIVVERGPHLWPEPGERVLDLAGRYVRRGLRDAHAHVVEWARAQRETDLSGARSAVAAAELVARADGRGLLRGGGFRDTGWPDRPSAGLLDRAAPGRAVVLRSRDMHSLWLSSAALALAGLPGHPTGLLQEHEAWDALARLPAHRDADDDDAVAGAVAAAHRRGLTAVRDFSFEQSHPAWARRQREAGGRLPLRVEAVVQPDLLASYVDRGLATGDGDAFLTVGPLKLFADGSLGSRTARCLTPYAGTDDRGLRLLDPEQLRRALEQARAARFAVAVHAIGDEATRDALHALQGAGVPSSIEHAQLLRPADLPLFARGGVTASLQPAHLLDDAGAVDDLWRGTPSIPYAVRSLVEAGARVVLGSDAPVSPLDPWRSIAAAVHRTDGTAPAWRPAEAVPLELALQASGARRPRPGDAADLVVLAEPPYALSAADLAAIPVHATFVGGRCVHGPWAQD
ncbi:MAG TPA: amidohydrolase family protein [Mycobacteriales bacterium]|nr:amidohydrolase family protein [Mycobacteriales bacterium]